MGWFTDVRATLTRIEDNTAKIVTLLEDIYTISDQEQQDNARRNAQPLT
jgi:hypothetical protein